MTNKTIPYNTGKAVTRDELDSLIKDAQIDGDWSKVEQANVSKITDMSCLFNDVNGIKDLNLDGWDTSNVISMDSMFYKSDYNHPLYFDTSKVKSMSCMFVCSVYNHPILFDTSKVTNMVYMFSNSKYNHPLDFNTSSVKDMESIFDNVSIAHPIKFTGGNIPDDIQGFIDETNTAYEEKCKLDSVVHNHHDNNVIASSFKL